MGGDEATAPASSCMAAAADDEANAAAKGGAAPKVAFKKRRARGDGDVVARRVQQRADDDGRDAVTGGSASATVADVAGGARRRGGLASRAVQSGRPDDLHAYEAFDHTEKVADRGASLEGATTTAGAGGAAGAASDGTYRGAAGYTDWRAGFRREGAVAHGPLKAPSAALKSTHVIDYTVSGSRGRE